MRSGHRHGNVFRDFFVAVDSCDFFDQIDLSSQVPAPRGGHGRDGRSIDSRLAQPQGGENFADLFRFDFDTENARYLIESQRYR